MEYVYRLTCHKFILLVPLVRLSAFQVMGQTFTEIVDDGLNAVKGSVVYLNVLRGLQRSGIYHPRD